MANGNSRAARSARAKLQLRDSKGRWIEMGRSRVSWYSSKNKKNLAGTAVSTPDGKNAIVLTDDGKKHAVSGRKLTIIEAKTVLPNKNDKSPTPTKPKAQDVQETPAQDDSESEAPQKSETPAPEQEEEEPETEEEDPKETVKEPAITGQDALRETLHIAGGIIESLEDGHIYKSIATSRYNNAKGNSTKKESEYTNASGETIQTGRKVYDKRTGELLSVVRMPTEGSVTLAGTPKMYRDGQVTRQGIKDFDLDNATHVVPDAYKWDTSTAVDVSKAGSVGEINRLMNEKYPGLNYKVEKFALKDAKLVAEGVDENLRTYPHVQDRLYAVSDKGFGEGSENLGAYVAHPALGGDRDAYISLHINPNNNGTRAAINTSQGRRNGWAVAAKDREKELNPFSRIINHEFGHVAEEAIVATKREKYDPKVIMETAEEALEKIYPANIDRDAKFRSALSEYGTTNHMETVAESVADVRLNGENASGFSKAITSELTRQDPRLEAAFGAPRTVDEIAGAENWKEGDPIPESISAMQFTEELSEAMPELSTIETENGFHYKQDGAWRASYLQEDDPGLDYSAMMFSAARGKFVPEFSLDQSKFKTYAKPPAGLSVPITPGSKAVSNSKGEWRIEKEDLSSVDDDFKDIMGSDGYTNGQRLTPADVYYSNKRKDLGVAPADTIVPAQQSEKKDINNLRDDESVVDYEDVMQEKAYAFPDGTGLYTETGEKIAVKDGEEYYDANGKMVGYIPDTVLDTGTNDVIVSPNAKADFGRPGAEDNVPTAPEPTEDEGVDTDTEAPVESETMNEQMIPGTDIERTEPVALDGEKFAPTRQQQDVIDSVVAGKDTLVQAKAGAGKTTTLEAIARRIPEKEVLYIAFNKSVQTEAEKRMPGNVESRTGHSLAYRWSPDWMKARMGGGKDRAAGARRQKEALRNGKDVAAHLGIFQDVNAYGLDEPFTPEEQAVAAIRTVDKFATSADDNVGPQHLPASVQEMPLEVQQAVVKSAMRAWNDLSDEDGKLKFTFDHSRKHWALSRPDLSKTGSGNGKAAEVVFLDEAQDTPPVLAKVVADQGTQKVIVGDADQAIYGFTGATDYLSQADKDVELPLNKSWRFGPEVADAGNRFLQLLGSKGRVEGGGPASKLVDGMEDADAILTRSNAGMIGEIMRELENGRSVGVPKGTKADLERLFNHADDLMKGRVPKNIHEDLAAFRKWEDFKKEAAKGDDPKLSMIDRLIEDNGIQVLRDTIARVVDPQDEAKTWGRPTNSSDVRADSKVDPKTGIVSNAYKLNQNLKDDAGRGGIGSAGYKWNKANRTWVPRDTSPAGVQKAIANLEKEIARVEATKGGNDPEVVPTKTDVTISTAHKAKGLEWGRVRIADDFKAPERDEETDEVKMPTPEELRLAYVAVTRAEKELDAGSLGWVYDYTDENGGIPDAPETAQGDAPESDSEAPEAPEDTPAPVEAPEAPSEPETAPEPVSTAKPKVNRDNGVVTVDGRNIGRIMPSPAGYSVITPDGKSEKYRFYPTQKKAAERLVELDARGEGQAPAPNAPAKPATPSPEPKEEESRDEEEREPEPESPAPAPTPASKEEPAPTPAPKPEAPASEPKAEVTETLTPGKIDHTDPDLQAKLDNAPTGAVVRASHDRGDIFYTKQANGQWQSVTTRGGSRYGEPGKAYGSDVITNGITKNHDRFNYQFGLPAKKQEPTPTPKPQTAPTPTPEVVEEDAPGSSAPRRGEPGTTFTETLEKTTAGRGRRPVRRTYYDEAGIGYSDGSFVHNKKTGSTVMVVKGISDGQVRVKDIDSGKEYTVLPKFLKSGITQEEQEQDTKTAEAPPMPDSTPKTAESDEELYKGSIGVDKNGKYFVDQEGKKVYKGGQAKFTFKGQELAGEVQTMFPSTGGAVILLPDGTKKQVRVHKLKGV